jgi:hypothetical protein
VRFYFEMSPSCYSIVQYRLCAIFYMNCLNVYAKAASISGRLLDFWFVALADVL